MIHHHWLISFHNYSEIVGSRHTICDSSIAWSFTQVEIGIVRAIKIEVSSHPFHWRLHFTNKIVVWTARKLIQKPKILNHIVFHTYLLQDCNTHEHHRSEQRLWLDSGSRFNTYRRNSIVRPDASNLGKVHHVMLSQLPSVRVVNSLPPSGHKCCSWN
jgi:hypothetical protein